MFTGTQCTTPDRTLSAEILVDDVPQPLYRRMDGALFVEALVGTPYVVRVTNATGGRVETILAIDGRNTQKDEPADLDRSHGLVMRESYDFRGWRDNNTSVNAFVFTAPKRSIAAQATDSTNNVGVIGIAVYREQPRMAFRGGFEENFGPTRGGPISYGATRGGSVGTGMGHQIADHVGTTTFNRDGSPTVLVIRYDTREVLERLGLLVPAEPEAFPGVAAFSGKYRSA
jgi:hypothetical protein